MRSLTNLGVTTKSQLVRGKSNNGQMAELASAATASVVLMLLERSCGMFVLLFVLSQGLDPFGCCDVKRVKSEDVTTDYITRVGATQPLMVEGRLLPTVCINQLT